VTEARAGLPILAFADAAAWEAWLAAQPRDGGVWLKLAKAGNPAASVTKAEAIDAALCHGWIDGQQAPFDQGWWLTRFTPRRPRGKWSRINRDRAEQLIAAGRVAPAGLAEIAAAQGDGRWDAAYAPASTAAVPEDLAAALAARPGARAFFDALDGANRYAILHRLETGSARTRADRVVRFAELCAAGETLHPRRPPRK
jgi:uncharacterized protein YdeI (YjbR/CyaY-like superfamily)